MNIKKMVMVFLVCVSLSYARKGIADQAYPLDFYPFGIMMASSSEQDIKTMESLNVGWTCLYLKTHAFPKQANGAPNFSALDTLRKRTQESNIQLIPGVSYLQGDIMDKASKVVMPKDKNAYRSLIRDLVDRYDGDGKNDMKGLEMPIHFWQISVNLPARWGGPDKEMIQYVALTSDIIREEDPAAVIAVGIIVSVPQHARKRYELLLKDGAPYYDILTIMPTRTPYKDVFECVQGVKKDLARHKADKDVWVMGLGSRRMFSDSARMAKAQRSILKGHVMAMAGGAQCVSWSTLRASERQSAEFGPAALMDAKGVKRPIYNGYVEMTKKLGSATSVQRLKMSDPLVFFVRFQLPTSWCYVVWDDRPGPQRRQRVLEVRNPSESSEYWLYPTAKPKQRITEDANKMLTIPLLGHEPVYLKPVD